MSSDTDSSAIYDLYCAHHSGQRTHSEITFQAALLSQYPSHSLISTPCDLIAYANAGHAIATLVEDVHPTLRSWGFEPGARQPSEGSPAGKLTQHIQFGQFDYVWHDHRFRVIVAEGQTGSCERRYYYVLSPPAKAGEKEKDQVNSKAMEALVLSAYVWSDMSHDIVWVYDQGLWFKDKELWRMIRSESWEDLILDERTKRSIIRDVEGFFDAKETYAGLNTPWKRGLIFHGSPGNGKTTIAKLLIKTLMTRSQPVPTLVVKTFAQRGYGPQMSVRQIFKKARQTAPCLLLFEDVDSLVTDQVRSYFFNEVDGLENNDGILMIASTNNLDKLDHGLSKRPSRFDRKYCFSTPSLEDRVRYCQSWSQKLSGRPRVEMSDTLPLDVASITDGFSFAYLKEAYVASLLSLAQSSTSAEDAENENENEEKMAEARKEGGGGEGNGGKWNGFGNILRQQIEILRQDIKA